MPPATRSEDLCLPFAADVGGRARLGLVGTEIDSFVGATFTDLFVGAISREHPRGPTRPSGCLVDGR